MAAEFVEGYGGARLAVHRVGEGRPVLLLHGLFSSAEINWIKYGTAAQLANAGFEAIMPDLRAHGQSEAPHDPAAYPEDVLVEDTQALVKALGLTDYDLGGFSLGARTAVRAVLAGLSPRRLVLGFCLTLKKRDGLVVYTNRGSEKIIRETSYWAEPRPGGAGWKARWVHPLEAISRVPEPEDLEAEQNAEAAKSAEE